jgi:hypothetical protein
MDRQVGRAVPLSPTGSNLMEPQGGGCSTTTRRGHRWVRTFLGQRSIIGTLCPLFAFQARESSNTVRTFFGSGSQDTLGRIRGTRSGTSDSRHGIRKRRIRGTASDGSGSNGSPEGDQTRLIADAGRAIGAGWLARDACVTESCQTLMAHTPHYAVTSAALVFGTTRAMRVGMARLFSSTA